MDEGGYLKEEASIEGSHPTDCEIQYVPCADFSTFLFWLHLYFKLCECIKYGRSV